MPSTPPPRKMIVASSTDVVATDTRTSPMLTNSAETIAVANTSNMPSTHRWTTHQRQYSMIEMWVCWP